MQVYVTTIASEGHVRQLDAIPFNDLCSYILLWYRTLRCRSKDSESSYTGSILELDLFTLHYRFLLRTLTATFRQLRIAPFSNDVFWEDSREAPTALRHYRSCSFFIIKTSEVFLELYLRWRFRVLSLGVLGNDDVVIGHFRRFSSQHNPALLSNSKRMLKGFAVKSTG